MQKFFATLFLSASILINAPAMAVQPYDSIIQLDYQPYFLPNSWQVLNVFNSVAGTVFIDVNSNDNGASRYIAQNVSNDVQVYAISTWDTSGSFQTFLSNVIQEGTTEIITRMSSEEASFALNVLADAIYVNTSDADTLFNDIGLWYPHLTETGVIIGDNWNFPDVALAVAQAASYFNLSISTNGTLWYLFK